MEGEGEEGGKRRARKEGEGESEREEEKGQENVDEQADIGADHSRGNHSIQDILIRVSSSVVQNLRKERDFIG